MAKGEERLHGRNDPIAACRRQLLERLGKSLQVAERDLAKQLAHRGKKSFDISEIRSGRMCGPAMQPELDELIIALGLSCDDGSFARQVSRL